MCLSGRVALLLLFVVVSACHVVAGQLSPEELATVTVLARGAQHREEAIRSVRLELTQHASHSEGSRQHGQAITRWLDPKSADDPRPLGVQLFRVRLLAEPGRLRQETLAIVGGPNSWAVTGRWFGATGADPVLNPKELGIGAMSSEPLPSSLVIEDGQRRLVYDAAKHTVHIEPQTTSLALARRDQWCDLLLFGRLPERGFGAELGLWAQNASKWNMSLAKERIAGHECYRVTAEGIPSKPRIFRWWVSPECGYLVLRYDETTQSDEFGRQSRFAEAVAAKEVSPGLWMPMETVIATYRMAAAGDPAVVDVRRNVLSSVELNVTVPPQAYHFQPPLGVEVMDTVSHNSWIEGGTTVGAITTALSTPIPDFDALFGFMPKWPEAGR